MIKDMIKTVFETDSSSVETFCSEKRESKPEFNSIFKGMKSQKNQITLPNINNHSPKRMMKNSTQSPFFMSRQLQPAGFDRKGSTLALGESTKVIKEDRTPDYSIDDE